MAKKKKSQLKPVARGFATTSVPKKMVQSDVSAESDTLATVLEGKTEQQVGSCDPAPSQMTSEISDPQTVDEQLLQNLVDRFQEKTEREILRTIKSIDMDRRFSKTLPHLELDPNIRDRIIILASNSNNREGSSKPLDGPEDKVLPRLAITYGVLRRLGFTEARVEECLCCIDGVDLDEAFEWLYTNCSESELQEKGINTNAETKVPRTPISSEPSRVPGTNARAPSPTTPIQPSTLDANAHAFVPSQRRNYEDPTIETSRDSIKVPTFENQGVVDTAASPEDDDPTTRYVQLKLQYDMIVDQLTLHQDSENLAGGLKRLRTQIEALKQDYLFDELRADAEYRVEREKVNSSKLQDKLRSSSSSPSLSKQTLPTPVKTMPNATTPISTTDNSTFDIFEDGFDDDQDSDLPIGGLLDILDIPVETNSRGSTITVRDMALPKHWSGRTPKSLLKENVFKADRYAAISYSIISGSSRAKRAAVSIRWEGRKMDEWTMEDVACTTEAQAELYIATIALHSLTFPFGEGFASNIAGTSGSQTFFRMLPAVYRDLWDELEASRKTRDETVNRNVWGKLRIILEPKLESNSKTNPRNIKQAIEKTLSHPSRILPAGSDNMNELLAADFRMRQASLPYQEMLVQRNQLPIARFRTEIIQLLQNSQVLVLSGETGCGKSTQVPAFILEDQLSQGKPCKIYCTEPRRISAISLAQRVSRELGDPPNAVGTSNSLVGYSIRLESNISKSTRLAFVTNGIALRMLEGGSGQGGQGTAFDEITHIVIDEVHERTIESDFMLIVLKSLVEQRSDLKIILMSATMDAEKISDYFGGCPILHVPGRTFPVDVRFLEDAVEYTKWRISDGSPYARRVHDKYYKGKNRPEWTEETLGEDDVDSEDNLNNEGVSLEKRYSPETANTLNMFDERLIPYDLIMRLLELICGDDPSLTSYSGAILVFMPGLGEIRRLNDLLMDHPSFGSSAFRVYPLHSTLSSESQGAVFDIPPQGIRKIVIATNIAETGITIPDITCVIDSGKHREMRFDEKRQISRLVETFIAKSNAAQRRGRAGRVQTGLCFHLFTKIRHDTQMADNPLPEMMRLSLSDLALRIKTMKVKMGASIEDVLSRALDPPASINIQRAISMLVEVRALTASEEITPMGRLLSTLPTDVHLGKFLLIATVFRCLDPALTIAAALNSKSPFLSPLGFEQEADRAKLTFKTENSDFLTIHNAFASWRRACANPGYARKFCRVNYLSYQNLQQIEDLRQQFLGYLIDSSFIQVDKSFTRELSRARFGRNRNRFVLVPQDFDCNSSNVFLVNAALTAGLYPKLLAVDSSNGQMRTITNNQQAAFHPSSINFGRKPLDFGVNHLVYFTLMHSKRLYAWETGPVDDIAIVLLCGESDFKLIADTVAVDRKIRFHVHPKTNIALKYLRGHLGDLLAHQYRGKPLTALQSSWIDIGNMVLGKIKPPESEEQTSIFVAS